jgi:hypothetical protein
MFGRRKKFLYKPLMSDTTNHFDYGCVTHSILRHPGPHIRYLIRQPHKIVGSNLSHINRPIPCVLQNYLPCLSHLKVTTMRAGQRGNLCSNAGEVKNISFLQAHPVSSLMGNRDSVRSMQLTTRINPVPKSRMHGAIPPLPHMPSWLVQGLHLFLHFMWHTLPLLVMKVPSWQMLRLPVSAIYHEHNFQLHVYRTAIISLVVSLIKCHISGDAPAGDRDG